MKKKDDIITTILELAKGPAVFAAIHARCKAQVPPRPITDLCSDSEVSWSTLWRMRSSKTVASLAPLEKIEATFKKWENSQPSNSSSISSGVIPKARQ